MGGDHCPSTFLKGARNVEHRSSVHRVINSDHRILEKRTPQTGSHQIYYNRPLPGIVPIYSLGCLGCLGAGSICRWTSTSPPPTPPGTQVSVPRVRNPSCSGGAAKTGRPPQSPTRPREDKIRQARDILQPAAGLARTSIAVAKLSLGAWRGAG